MIVKKKDRRKYSVCTVNSMCLMVTYLRQLNTIILCNNVVVIIIIFHKIIVSYIN